MPDSSTGALLEKCDDFHGSREAGTSVCVSSKPSSAGKGEDSETNDENGPLPVPKFARMVSRRRYHRLHILVDHRMCRDGRSEELLLKRRAVRTLAARRYYQTALGSFLTFVQERTLHLVEIDAVLVAYWNDCFLQGVQHHHGSRLLAVVMDRWPSFSRFGSSKLPKNHPYVAMCTLILRVTFMRLLSHRLCHFSHVGRS